MIRWLFMLMLVSSAALATETRTIYLAAADGSTIEIGAIDLADDGTYAINMNDASFEDHFLSMRPFKCLEGPAKHWCHVPYPYEIKRNLANDLTDLEYDLLFLWKGATEYGINMWNGVYYRIHRDGDQMRGVLHEMDMDLLSAPPDAGELRPLAAKDLHESDPDSHWLPYLMIK